MLVKFRKLTQELGWLNGLLYLLHTSLNKLTIGRFRIIKYYLYYQPIPETPLLPPNRGKQIEIKTITADDTGCFEHFPRPLTVIKRRFAEQGQCFAAYLKGNFVGYIWISQVDYPEDEVRCLFSPRPVEQTAWDYDVYITPAARLGFAFPKLWQSVNEYLSQQGVKWTLCRISAFNTGSLASHQRLGATRMGAVTFICIGSWQLMLASHAPYIHLSISQRHTPQLLLPIKSTESSVEPIQPS
ncbi:GNAT family N-acetyltransferase [Spartinivicinus ruber]|uniref:GNAT family N-acetyltransferase n=1 Tax=Spartinivicinus ruber TaxID=2683272 RepID=UPI0013D8307B|nr:GNAT family N-acetyltransferase [Spartinivicinus ruber]